MESGYIGRLVDFGEGELLRPVLVLIRKPYGPLQAPPEHDGAPLPAPALEPNLALLGPEALTGVHPLPLRKLLDHAPDGLGQTQLEEIGKPAGLKLRA